MSNINRNVRVEFGIVGIGGFMSFKKSGDGYSSEILNPIFACESSKIKTTFNRNLSPSFGKVEFEDNTSDENGIHYQRKFLRNVLWNFGDGTLVEGYNVEHSYKKPGKYKITCVFFDINRQGWNNTFSVVVQVKEVIPTLLRFSENKNDHKEEIKCSKIEKITRLESLLAKNVDEINVVAKRIFSEKEHNDGLPKSYWDVKNEKYFHMLSYYCFLKNNKRYLNNKSVVHSSYMEPIEKYSGDYYEIYGKLQFNEVDKKLVYNLGVYYPHTLKDKAHFSIKCIDPNSNILEEEKYIDVPIRHISSFDEIGDMELLGKRAFIDIYYKNDILSKEIRDNVFSFFYDIEEQKINNEMKYGSNYLNILPLGMSITVIPNNIQDTRIALSLNGFLRNVDIDAIYHIDEYFYNSMVKDYKLDGYFMPYIPYRNEELEKEITSNLYSKEISDFISSEISYYVPKDISIKNIKQNYISSDLKGRQSETTFNNFVNEDVYHCYTFDFGDFINLSYEFTVGRNNISNKLFPLMILKKKSISDISSLVIPKEKFVDVDVKRLVNLYLGHPMFEESEKLKESLELLLKNNNFLSYVMTKGENFLDDRMNIKTCYLSNLLSLLKMMGEEITDYETSEFEGINDMRDFVRILSMNHNDLVGHNVYKDVNIKINDDFKGVNVGRKMDINDKLIISTYVREVGMSPKGLIMGFQPYLDEKYGTYRNCYSGIYGTHLILRDKYTNETRLVSFTTIPNLIDILKEDEKTGRKYISLKDYDETWGWNLLLTERFKAAKKELKLANITSSRRKRLETVCGDIIEGYYNFYLFNPIREKERIGNFLDEKTITDNVEDVEKWTEKWGFVNDILMKIIIENSNLKNDVVPKMEIEENNISYLTTISEKRYFGSDEKITYEIWYGDTKEEHGFYLDKDASLSISSHISNDDTEYTISVSLSDIRLMNYNIENYFENINFKNKSRINLPLNIDRESDLMSSSIELEEITIPLYVDEEEKYDARLKLSISGIVSRPIITAMIIIEKPL